MKKRTVIIVEMWIEKKFGRVYADRVIEDELIFLPSNAYITISESFTDRPKIVSIYMNKPDTIEVYLRVVREFSDIEFLEEYVEGLKKAGFRVKGLENIRDN